MRVIAKAKTDVGRRRQGNEDAILVDEGLGLFVVCDGMGGHAAGEVASNAAIEAIRERVAARLPGIAEIEPELRAAALAELLRDAVERANTRVYELGADDTSRRGAGTTCTALCIYGGKAALAHVGDTRLYLMRGGQVHQISNDHTFLAEAMRRGMPRAEAMENFATNMLSRAVGPHPHVDIDTLSFDLLPADRLMLCSDGLHGYFVEPSELRPFLEKFSTAPDRLVDAANEAGGEDNISVIVLEVSPEAPPAGEDSVRLSRVTQALRALSGIEVLRELTYSELLEVIGALRSEDQPAGTVIIREGEASAAFYIIASGRAAVERGRKRLAELGQGSHFGEMALLTNRPRSATVVTLEPSRLLVLTREALYPLFQHNPVLAVKFLWNLGVRQSLRLDETTEWLSTGRDAAPDTLVESWGDEVVASPFSRRP
ncbi:MAG: cyclic nucleotide-binding domain-containing protein [Myxococcales bacterium]|nr:cyclic nucleotide-binding domain-containing protein [Myxococcales bacterium]